jgi:hypothetical protein
LKGGSGDGCASDLGGDSVGVSSEMSGWLPTLLLKPDCAEDGTGELGMELIGGLVEMRMLTSGERNIWRIGSLQSVNSNPVEEVVGVAVVVGDGLLRFDERDGGGSVKHHKLGVSWMAAPTMLSPSSFPQTSENMSESEKRDIKKP